MVRVVDESDVDESGVGESDVDESDVDESEGDESEGDESEGDESEGDEGDGPRGGCCVMPTVWRDTGTSERSRFDDSDGPASRVGIRERFEASLRHEVHARPGRGTHEAIAPPRERGGVDLRGTGVGRNAQRVPSSATNPSLGGKPSSGASIGGVCIAPSAETRGVAPGGTSVCAGPASKPGPSPSAFRCPP